MASIFGIKSISCDGKALWFSDRKLKTAAELNVATNEMDRPTKINGLALKMILIVISKYLNQYLCPVSFYNTDHTVPVQV